MLESGGVSTAPVAVLPVLPSPVRPADDGAAAVGHRRIWRPRHSKCPEETDADPAWYRHKRHVLVFTYSGKPVYTRYGSEEGLSSTTGALSAIVSKFTSFFFNSRGQTDSLRYMVAGEHTFVFLERGPLWLVCISRCGGTYPDLVRLLDRVHMQIITILTAGIEKTLKAHPNYDMRNLLGGTDSVVNSVVRWCTQDMFLHLDGFEPLPIAPAFRSLAVEVLRSARIPNILCAFVMAGHRILALVQNRQFRANALDLAMVINMIMSSSSLRMSESWTPVCLTRLNDKAFAYAYISFVEDSDVGLVFLSTASDGEQFYAISQQAAEVKRQLRQRGVLEAVGEAVAACPVSLAAGAAGAGGAEERSPSRQERTARRSVLSPPPALQWRLLEGVIHAAYFVPSLQQYFSSAVAAPYQSRRRTKMLFRSYGRCRLLLRNARLPSQICIATDHECFYVSLANEYHMYLAVPRGISTGVIGQFSQWVKSQEAHLFLGHTPTW